MEEEKNEQEVSEEQRPSKYELKKQKKEDQRKQHERKSFMQKFMYAGIGLFVVVALGGALVWVLSQQEPIEEGDIVSRSSIHWHPTLEIRINGERQEVSSNIGGGHGKLHTHDSSGTLHYEPSGPVLKDDVTLGATFRTWGREFSSQCIFEYCNGEEGTVKMFVNGEQNEEFENYLVNDGDRIEIIYE